LKDLIIMWLVTSLIAAVSATIAWRLVPKNYRMDILSIMLWGLTAMIFVDHILTYESGSFLEMETDGLVANGVLLGLLMLIPVFAIWLTYLAFTRYRANLVKG